MKDTRLFFNKELSWLAFNERVLQEAKDPKVPVIERVHFLGIYSSNLDEFFRVRVGKVRRTALVEAARAQNAHTDYMPATSLLSDIMKKVRKLTEDFKDTATEVFAELKEQGIELLFNDEKSTKYEELLTPDQKDWLKAFFAHKIIRHITPIIINSKTQLSSCLEDDGIYFLVALSIDDKKQFLLIEVPREKVNRFIIMPDHLQKGLKRVLMLDDIVHYFLEDIFKGVFEYQAIEAYSIKLTRNAELDVTDELDESLIEKMSKGLRQRLKAEPARLGYDQNMPEYMVKFLYKQLKIKELDNLVAGVRFRHFKDFISFPNLGDSSLEKKEFEALESAVYTLSHSIFDAISKQDMLVYYPYYKFRHITEFVRQASYSPSVKEIKINIYRVAKDSEIIHSLIEAVKNGKQVTVVVELRARFDEEANMAWATRMKDAGIKVEFGIPSLKVHAKLCLITRQEEDKLVRYAHIGTGNFHEKNARIYTDYSLFTTHKEICQEVENVFSFIAHSYKRFRFNHLIVSPLTSRRKLYQLIDNEIDQVTHDNKAEITLKLNNLVDKGLINRLYSASNAGVKIKVVLRGMCSLIPGVPGLSENIKIISIIDQFLEHPRVMVFHNRGEKLVYISSFDWMERNIDQRVEVACPIYDVKLKQRIIHMIDLHFKDNCKARLINKEQNNRYQTKGKITRIRSQMEVYDYLKAEEELALKEYAASTEK
ncbi:MAG: polyphosphate kinase 1 [Colwellia sp.]